MSDLNKDRFSVSALADTCGGEVIDWICENQYDYTAIKNSVIDEIEENHDSLAEQLAAAKDELERAKITIDRYIKRNEQRKDDAKTEIAEYRNAIDSVIRLQHYNYGDGMATHIHLESEVVDLNKLLAKHKGK